VRLVDFLGGSLAATRFGAVKSLACVPRVAGQVTKTRASETKAERAQLRYVRDAMAVSLVDDVEGAVWLVRLLYPLCDSYDP
jgi:hypothetical protein